MQINVEFIEKELQVYNLKIIDFETVSDGIYKYNDFIFTFETEDDECNVFADIYPIATIEDTIRIKHGDNLKEKFKKKLENYF